MRLSGVPADLEGGVYIARKKDGNILVEIDNHPHIYLKRIIDEKYKTITNDEFRLKGDPKLYSGRQVFARQVEEARNAGYKKIECWAVRNDDNGYNGYYTWARLGYTPNKSASKPLNDRLKNNGYKDIQDVMSTQIGRDFWKSKGNSFNAEFDLSKTSYSSRTLDKYLIDKKSD